MSGTTGIVCMIGSKTGVLDERVYGRTLSELDQCCVTFRHWFTTTGNEKISDFSRTHAPYTDEKNGFNFVSRGGELQLELKVDGTRQQICFCPFCGAKIEVKETSRVLLKEKKKSIPDGFEEQKIG